MPPSFQVVRPFVLVAGLLGLFAAVPSSASAVDCNHRFVDTGDSEYYVQSLCGAPAWVTSRTMVRSNFGYLPDRWGVVGASAAVGVQVDTWIYDFGPNRFMVELTFEDGLLVYERTLHYGSRAGHPPPSH